MINISKFLVSQVEKIPKLPVPIEISTEIKNISRIERNEVLQSSTDMSSFKVKCPKNGVIFLNFTRLDMDASIKIYFTIRPLKFSEILNENYTLTIDGSNKDTIAGSFNYKCSFAMESLVYMSIVSNGAIKTSTGRIEFSFELNTVQCLYWATDSNAWQSDGCLVDGELSTFHRIHCKCNHLSLFAAKNHKSDFCAVFPDTVPNAPMKSVIWICFLFLSIIFSLMALWAWRSDKFDKNHQKLIYLKNSYTSSNRYYYAITVVTGGRPNANTTSHVAIKVHGNRFTSEVIPLFDRGVPLFQRGSINNFIVQTGKYVGHIEMITLCHDCNGSHPAWYCEAITIRDLQRNEEWNFDVNRWFTKKIADKTLIASINVSTETKYYKRNRSIRLHCRKLLHNSYSLFGICLRRPGGKLSRLERVYIMFTSIVFGLMSNVVFLSYHLNENHSNRNILMSAIVGFCTTFMLRLLLIFVLIKSKNVKKKNRHWTLMFQSESI